MIGHVGPLLLPGIVTTLVALLILGYALLYWPHLPADFNVQEKAQSSRSIEALYFSGITFTTLLAERGLHADHVTVWRWVQRYAPEIEQRLRSRLKPTNDSWRVDETYIRVKGNRRYLYRAVDSSGTRWK